MENQDLANNKSNYLCRQSSTRWTPTSDQIRILKELYYNNGIRSPTADQIQRIAARLRHYGKIEGKNVFYWFQNHKARERQKKRFTPSAAPQQQQPPSSLFHDHHNHHHHQHMHVQSHQVPYFYKQQLKLHSAHSISQPEGGSSSSSQGFMAVGYGYGPVSMEKGFRDRSISPEEDELSTEIETLPLFPIPGGSTASDSHHDFFKMKESMPSELNNGGYYIGGNWFHSDGRTSLELSLNSYGYYD